MFFLFEPFHFEVEREMPDAYVRMDGREISNYRQEKKEPTVSVPYE